ncbi:MAG: hypothetical protein ACFFG0_21385 [Candidatus Thorarchaeota archaeon]
MLNGEYESENIADRIITEIGSHALTKYHSRHLSADFCRGISMKIEMMGIIRNYKMPY